MAAYQTDAATVLSWSLRKLRGLAEARVRRERIQMMWQLAVAQIPVAADPQEYIQGLVESVVPEEELWQMETHGALRLDLATDDELRAAGVMIVDNPGQDDGRQADISEPGS